MSQLPKLKVSFQFERLGGEICDFEQAKYRFDNSGIVILVEGQLVRSYEELLQLATQERYKDKEFLEMLVLPVMGGG